jgi:transposase-like protein
MNEARIIRAAAARGATVAETAAKLGCSVATAWRRWRDLGLPMAPRGPRPGSARPPAGGAAAEPASRAGRTTDEAGGGCMNEARIIRAAAARGATVAETAVELGCSVSRAYRLWRDLGLPRGPRGPRRGSAHPSASVAEVEQALRAGQSIGEVARARGVSRQAISDLARRHGFPVQALRRSNPRPPKPVQSGSATARREDKDLRGVWIWVPGR